jgi:hypothetical protein
MRWVILVFISVALFGCNSVETDFPGEEAVRYFCDAETVKNNGGQVYFESDTLRFLGGTSQSDDMAFEGRYSARLDSVNPYGMTFVLKDVKEGEYFEARVKTFDDNSAGNIIVALTSDTTYTLVSTCHGADSAGSKNWREQFINFTVNFPVREVSFFLFSNSRTCYFDNFEILRYPAQPAPQEYAVDPLRISIDEVSYETLKDYQRRAREKGVISDEFKQYVPIHVLKGGDSVEAEMRLKGDWTDHLETGKTSYRIKMSDQGSFRNLMSFSIQHPQTRHFMHEWFVHRWCEEEGLLATRYDFLPVEINGEYAGVYALEEHFDKQLIESRSRREGPILKIDETGFWALLTDSTGTDRGKNFPYYEAAIIDLFKKNRTAKSQSLSAQFNNAAILLERFKNCDPDPADLFDLDQLARFYAIMDVGNITHGTAWHNYRFYANPVTAKLEMIGFDMQPAFEPKQNLRLIEVLNRPELLQYNEFMLTRNLFAIDEFTALYLGYVRKFSSPAYLDSLFAGLSGEISEKERILGMEYPNFTFDKSFYYDKAKKNCGQVDSLESTGKRNFFNGQVYRPVARIYTPNLDGFNLPDLGINPYVWPAEVQPGDTGKFCLLIENFHLNDIELRGYSLKGNKDSIIPFDNVVLKGFTSLNSLAKYEATLTEPPNKIYYTVQNVPGIVNMKKAIAWKKPVGLHPRTELTERFSPSAKWYTVSGNQLVFKQGNHTIGQLILIPEKYEVIFEPGCNIDFVTGGGLIMNNNVRMAGTAENLISFNSSDSSSNGVTILKADSVLVQHVSMKNLSTLDYKGWTLTGAFTIYESDVKIDNLEISDNFCEDALNTVRCMIEVKNLTISNTAGDAFDADFCYGSVMDSWFHHTYNDCIDFSGSTVTIQNCRVEHAGDKGISAGENSSLIAVEMKISNCVIGMAAKDGARLKVTDSSVENCRIGAMTYTKKPEYDFSSIELEKIDRPGIEQPGIPELGSTISVDGKVYKGTMRINVDALYARFVSQPIAQ